jgi:hypothetical protein
VNWEYYFYNLLTVEIPWPLALLCMGSFALTTYFALVDIFKLSKPK